jgi:hypothetical protein
MLEPYSQSAILVYQSPCVTSFLGSVINFIDFSDQPVIFSVISENTFSIFMINPFDTTPQSFLEDIMNFSCHLFDPLYLFHYDTKCLQKYEQLFQVELFNFFSNFKLQIVEDKRFADLEDFYSFTLPECFSSFFTNDMYIRYAKSGDMSEIITFVKSIMFSKVILLIDSFGNYSFPPAINTDISLVIRGNSVIKLPDHSCLLDIQTIGLDEYSDIILFSIYKANTFITYYLTDNSAEGQQNFRDFIIRSLEFYEVVYVFNSSFENKFFPTITKFVDITFNKYQYWASTRKLVHLPHFHLDYDPGSGKNVPIWNKLYLIEANDSWKDLIFRRTIVNILTKVAILSSNEFKIPFSDPFMADSRKLKHPHDFFDQFATKKNNLIKKKVLYYPTEFHAMYNFEEGKFSEMYIDNLLFFEESEEDDL